jgi:hypothetical protein
MALRKNHRTPRPSDRSIWSFMNVLVAPTQPTGEHKVLRPGFGRPLRRLGDEQLASLIAAGERDAFAVAYERHLPALIRYCRGILLVREDAEDAAQSAMVAALRALPQRPPQLRLRAWLFRVAHNEAGGLRPARPAGRQGQPRRAPGDAGLARGPAADRPRCPHPRHLAGAAWGGGYGRTRRRWRRRPPTAAPPGPCRPQSIPASRRGARVRARLTAPTCGEPGLPDPLPPECCAALSTPPRWCRQAHHSGRQAPLA